MSSPGEKSFLSFIVLSAGQLAGWGSAGVLAVASPQISADLGFSLAMAYTGNTVFYVAMGLCAPLLAGLFNSYGARTMLATGALVMAVGHALLSISSWPLTYFTAWAILGVGGAATLTTAAHIFLSEQSGKAAAGAIGALMIVTGLSSSIFWPLSALLMDVGGWRGTSLIYAVMMVLVCALYRVGLPPATASVEPVSGASSTGAVSKHPKAVFWLIVAPIALNAFVTYGFSAVMIELFKALGMSPARAVTAGALMGVVQVSARGLDMLSAGRWTGVASGLGATLALMFSIALLLSGDGSMLTIVPFILLYGIGSGVFAVARATIPLAFYDRRDYARAASRIALPLNLMSAVAAPVLAWLLTNSGTAAVLLLALGLLGAASMLLFSLHRLSTAFLSRTDPP